MFSTFIQRQEMRQKFWWERQLTQFGPGDILFVKDSTYPSQTRLSLNQKRKRLPDDIPRSIKSSEDVPGCLVCYNSWWLSSCGCCCLLVCFVGRGQWRGQRRGRFCPPVFCVGGMRGDSGVARSGEAEAGCRERPVSLSSRETETLADITRLQTTEHLYTNTILI